MSSWRYTTPATVGLSLVVVAISGHEPARVLWRDAHASMRVSGHERTWRAWTPERRVGDLPLVILIHGSGDNAASLAERSGFAALAARERFVLVAPAVAYPGAGWTAHPGLFEPGAAPADDVAFLEALVREAPGRYGVDPSRVFVVGHKSGAMMAYRLAAATPNAIAGVGVVNGSLAAASPRSGRLSRITPPSEFVPLVALHGAHARSIPPDGATKPGASRVFGGFFAAPDRWSAALPGAWTAPKEVRDAQVRILRGPTGSVASVAMLLEGEGDDWPANYPAAWALWANLNRVARR